MNTEHLLQPKEPKISQKNALPRERRRIAGSGHVPPTPVLEKNGATGQPEGREPLICYKCNTAIADGLSFSVHRELGYCHARGECVKTLEAGGGVVRTRSGGETSDDNAARADQSMPSRFESDPPASSLEKSAAQKTAVLWAWGPTRNDLVLEAYVGPERPRTRAEIVRVLVKNCRSWRRGEPVPARHVRDDLWRLDRAIGLENT